MVNKPEMYHMEHYLKDAQTLPKEALAIVSEQDMLGYEKEYAVYQKIQQEAVQKCSTLVSEVKERISVLFGGNYSKQYKYFDRAVMGGEILTDQHNSLFPKPNVVRDLVETAKLRCPNIQTDNSVGGRSNESVEEMNSAVSYLLGEGLTLNTDFTVGNAVEVAKARKATEFHANMASKLRGYLDGTKFPKMAMKDNFKGTSCVDDDCLSEHIKFDAIHDKFDCKCGSNSYKGCVGTNAEGCWEFSVTDA